ncbi:MAG: Holliday junction DNA helicase RuvA [Desulfuromonadaceae bacterium GWC2_58_13]|nr:MAG: Holliday junction DNA helicase RuvA [Desulfuromonadaceae bacterium GWC2_58_13]
MIALLTGKLAYKSIDHLIVDVGGVGYRLQIPLSSFYSLPESGEVRLHVYTYVKEDAIHLFGFLTLEEKELFILLRSVSGIGPKLAINILSNIPASELRAALYHGDSKRLSAIPGIGKKTAERLILELQEKIKKLGNAEAPASPTRPARSASNVVDDSISALVNLGYKEVQARKALETLEIATDASVEAVLKGALKILMK